MASAGQASGSTGSASDPGFVPNGIVTYVIPEELELRTLYPKLTPDQRTWRCEQTKLSTELGEKAWEMLAPILEGHWDREQTYQGISFFVKAIYEAQGYPVFVPKMIRNMGELMRIIQEKVPWITMSGRRMQADDNPGRYALRVAFNCLGTLLVANLPGPDSQLTSEDAESHARMKETAFLMASSCIDKLGGTQLHEGNLSPDDAAAIARLATAGSSADAERACNTVPLPLIALYMLQALYDIDMLKVKWALHYVAARCAKDTYARARTADPNSASVAPPRAAWLSHCQALVALEPGSPICSFMLAEARTSITGSNPETLAAMRAAARAAERRGDDLIAWLAHLNVAQILSHAGAGGDCFVEDDVLKALDAAAAQKASVKRWGGTLMLEIRCRALREDILSELQEARTLAEEQRASGRPPLPVGVLPCTPRSRLWRLTPITPLTPRECAGCHHLFHKTMACGRCRQVWYCGRECQSTHWKAGHKAECAKLAAAAAKAASGEGAGSDNADE